jgi:DnaJ-class molecular chaperone
MNAEENAAIKSDEIGGHGLAPSPVRCDFCDGLGTITYNPNLNPNDFQGIAFAKCGQCGGTGTQL